MLKQQLTSRIDPKPVRGVQLHMKTIVIGDVHGCREELRELLDKLNYSPGKQRILLLGDLLDKGPDPVGVVADVRELVRGSSHVHCIRGNHEEKALRWRKHEERRATNPDYVNPMRIHDVETPAQWAALTLEDVAWLKTLPTVWDGFVPGWAAVHGGFLPGLPIHRQPSDKVVRVRWVDAAGEFVPLQDGTLDKPDWACNWMDVWDGKENVVYGHAVHGLEEPRVDVNEKGVSCVGIDTGCVFGGRLTAMVFEDGRHHFIQVQAKRAYRKLPTSGE